MMKTNINFVLLQSDLKRKTEPIEKGSATPNFGCDAFSPFFPRCSAIMFIGPRGLRLFLNFFKFALISLYMGYSEFFVLLKL